VPRLDSTSLRYLASVASIAIGVILFIYVVLHDEKKPEARVVEPTQAAQPGVTSSDAPISVLPSPVSQPPLPEAAPALVKGTEDDCSRGWRFIDNPQQRWTVCLPLNLLYFDGRDVLPFENATPQDTQRIFGDFAAVNEPWYLGSTAASTVDVLAPMSLKIEVVAPTTALDGCPIRQQTPSDGGTVTCTDRLEFLPSGQPQFTSDGSYQRFRALTPTQPSKPTTEAFSLALTIYSYGSNSTLQQRLFGLILESLKPY
jgi:hypothetical protein